MARIKIKNEGWVMLEDDTARKIRQDWESNIPKETIIEVGAYTIPLGDITGFYIEPKMSFAGHKEEWHITPEEQKIIDEEKEKIRLMMKGW